MYYRFEYRESFWQDYLDALSYIANVLKNPIAARELDGAFEQEKLTLLSFPKADRPHASPPEVDEDYDALPIKNYLAFYVVRDGVIVFRRFLYSRSALHDRFRE